MALPLSQMRFTPDEYLEFERNAEIRHEYIDGHVYAMSGESRHHSRVNVNLIS